MNLLRLSIEELFPSILNRQYFFIYPDESIHLASVCLIPSIDVYIDGVIVIENNKPIGRIGNKHILSAYYKLGKEAFYKEAKEVMLDTKDHLTMDSSLEDLLEDLLRNRVGFAPVVDDGIIAVASIYDILRVIVKSSIGGDIKSIGSKIITIDDSYSIKDAIESMLKHSIRRLFIKSEDEFYAIVGRDILGFLMENEVVLNKHIDIASIKVGILPKHKIIRVDGSISIKDAAILLLQQHAPSSLIRDDYVITPLDIIRAIKYK